MIIKQPWWKEVVVYQIYVRSFKDTDQDGIGDLPGILGSIPYLKQLGVDAIYLNPINKSPNDDFGYDISDFYGIMDEFGTLADFDELIRTLHDHGIRFIMDLVINHSSDEHPWFKEARTSRDNPFHDFYIWRDGKAGGPPNNWPSFFGGSAWAYNEATDEYYLHLFSRKQPDFNFTNDQLIDHIKDILRFWIDRGVDGFRFDAINHIAKDLEFPDGPMKPGDCYGDFIPFVQNLPKVHDYIRELRRDAITLPDFFVAGEAGGIGFENAHLYTAQDSNELDVLFHFDMHSIGRGPQDWLRIPVDLRKTIKRSFTGWATRPDTEGWNPVFYSNHDTTRTVSRIGDDAHYREASAKALALLQLTQRGTPFIYYGDEIGMTNAWDFKLTDYRDIAVFQKYEEQVVNGIVSPGDYLTGLHYLNRDNARTPMQWNSQPGAGFSTATPWIPLNQNYQTINVESELQTPDSIFHFYQTMIHLRRVHPVLIHGSLTEYLPHHEQIYVYTRQGEVESTEYLILLNLTSKPAQAELPIDLTNRLDPPVVALMLSNYPNRPPLESVISLLPWEARLYAIKSLKEEDPSSTV
ncbi:MAG: alpha-glucosidase [Clostridiaceae bacterium]